MCYQKSLIKIKKTYTFIRFENYQSKFKKFIFFISQSEGAP